MPEEMNVTTPNNEEGRQDGAKELPVFDCTDEACDISFGAGVGRKLLDAITGAKKSIRIISPYFSEETINILIPRCLEGVSVSLITSVSFTSRLSDTKTNSIKKLINKVNLPGNESEFRPILNTVFFKDAPCDIHLKLYIIDGQFAYTGSLNFSDWGLNKNYESFITIKNTSTIEKLISYFDQLHDTTCIERWDVNELVKNVQQLGAEENK